MKQAVLRSAAILATALAAGFGSGNLYAMPAGHDGPAGMGIFQGLEKIHASLQLDASQEALWQTASNLGTSVGSQIQSLHQQARSDVATELAKAQPDLAALAQRSDAVHQQTLTLHNQVRDQWLAVYAALNANQKSLVADFLRQRGLRMGGRHK